MRIIRPPEKIIKKNLYNFALLDSSNIEMGMEVAFLGYPFGKYPITCHKGMVSSIYQREAVSFIQIDASVNSGNSGGPLFLPGTGEVVVIITRKENGITHIFSKLKQSLKR